MPFSKTVSMTTKALIGIAVCVSSTPALANSACALSLQGCVLPLTEAAPAPVPVATPVAVAEPEGGGLGILPILAGLAALGVLAYLLLDDDNEATSP